MKIHVTSFLNKREQQKSVQACYFLVFDPQGLLAICVFYLIDGRFHTAVAHFFGAPEKGPKTIELEGPDWYRNTQEIGDITFIKALTDAISNRADKVTDVAVQEHGNADKVFALASLENGLSVRIVRLRLHQETLTVSYQKNDDSQEVLMEFPYHEAYCT